MNILLTGASGFIGRAILRSLLDHGHNVIACCRHTERLLVKHERLNVLAIDFMRADSIDAWLPHLPGIDAVVNSVGIIAETRRQTFAQLHTRAPLALFAAAAQAGVNKIVQISALGADEQAVSAYHSSKKAADDGLRKMPLNWFVLQPSVVYGHGGRSSALFHALAALPVHGLPDGGRQPIQPIHIDDVAAATCRCLEPGVKGQQTLALVGPIAIAYADWLQGLRYRLGKAPAMTWSIPLSHAVMLAGLGRWLGESILNRDNVLMLSRGNSADTAAITELLGRPPVNVTENLFQTPANRAERWQAQLYFFPALTLTTIALVWLWSGITSLLFYPHELSYRLLADTGIVGWAAPATLYGLAAMDMLLGAATLYRFRTKTLMLWQFGIVLGYSFIVAWRLPEYLFHPFGPLLKNLPFMLLLLIHRILEGEKP